MGAELTIHVAAAGTATGDGTMQRPYQTLVRAREALRAARQAGTLRPGQAATVRVDAGVYPLDSSFALTTEDSGTAGAEVVYRAPQRGQARIRGGITLAAASFAVLTDPVLLARLEPAARDKVRVCSLTTRVPGVLEPFKTAYRGTPTGPWLYLNGQPPDAHSG